MADSNPTTRVSERVQSGTHRLDRRHQAMRQPRLRRRQRLAIGAVGAAIFLILAVFAIGYVVAFVLPPRELVVSVNDVKYTRGDLVELVRIKQRSAEFAGESIDASTNIFESLQTVVENEIIKQSAPSLGVTVSDSEIDTRVDAMMRPSEQESLGKSDEQITRETKERYSSYLNMVQIDEPTHRELVRKSMLREKVRTYVGDSVPFVAEQVYLFRLVMSSRGEIDIMNIKFEDAIRGANNPATYQAAFFEIVREFSEDIPETIRRGGEIGWVAKGVIPDYEYAFFDLEPGQITDPIPNVDNKNQLYFFMISDKQKGKELSPSVRDELKNKALVEWVNQQRKSHEVYAVFNSDIYNWIFEQMKISIDIPEPTPDPFQQILGGP